MNETEPTHERQPRHRAAPSPEDLGLVTTDEAVREQWREGLERGGTAFAAFTRIGSPKLHTPDVLQEFRETYRGSFPSWEAAMKREVVDLGWAAALVGFRNEQGIPEQIIQWNYDELRAVMSEVYDGIETDGQVHLFLR